MRRALQVSSYTGSDTARIRVQGDEFAVYGPQQQSSQVDTWGRGLKMKCFQKLNEAFVARNLGEIVSICMINGEFRAGIFENKSWDLHHQCTANSLLRSLPKSGIVCHKVRGFAVMQRGGNGQQGGRGKRQKGGHSGSRFYRCPVCGLHVALLLAQQVCSMFVIMQDGQLV